ncbi:MAG: hypothetical protein QM650_19310 [Microlunatus sp.]
MPAPAIASAEARLAETLAAYRAGEEVSENDAMALAKAELAAARAVHPTV